MIGTKLYQNKSRVNLFLMMYGILAFIGAGLITLSLYRNQNPSGSEGFMMIFGAGMAFMTWRKGRMPRVVIREDFMELHQQFKPQSIMYKSISNVVRTKDKRLLISVRYGHDIKDVTVWLKDLEDADAEKLTEFCQRKGWKQH